MYRSSASVACTLRIHLDMHMVLSYWREAPHVSAPSENGYRGNIKPLPRAKHSFAWCRKGPPRRWLMVVCRLLDFLFARGKPNHSLGKTDILCC